MPRCGTNVSMASRERFKMRITGCLQDLRLIYGNSYHVMTDGKYDYQVSPESDNEVFIGWIEWTKMHKGFVQTRYVKGCIVPFSDKDPITREPVKSVNDVVHHIIIFMTENPNEFEEMFKKKAKPGKGKKGKYPKISKEEFKDIIQKNAVKKYKAAISSK